MEQALCRSITVLWRSKRAPKWTQHSGAYSHTDGQVVDAEVCITSAWGWDASFCISGAPKVVPALWPKPFLAIIGKHPWQAGKQWPAVDATGACLTSIDCCQSSICGIFIPARVGRNKSLVLCCGVKTQQVVCTQQAQQLQCISLLEALCFARTIKVVLAGGCGLLIDLGKQIFFQPPPGASRYNLNSGRVITLYLFSLSLLCACSSIILWQGEKDFAHFRCLSGGHQRPMDSTYGRD